jgi:hypothetical protein
MCRFPDSPDRKLQGLRRKSGAAFGATLFRYFVLFGAAGCNVDNKSNSFILLSLFGSVQGGTLGPKDGLKIRRS